MYEAEIHLQQEKDCVLSELSRDYREPVDVEIEALHDGMVTFVIHAEDRVDAFHRQLADAEAVEHLEELGDGALLVTKSSCGAYNAVYGNHGILRRSTHISHERRIYDVLAFDHEHVRDIVLQFKQIGTVTLGRLEEVGDENPTLTDRQLEVVEFALDRGYYDWPRERAGDELADELDISRPTFLEHLRKAERKLLWNAVRSERRKR